jgi:hypothetical protein
MAEIPLGFSFEESDDGYYILRHNEAGKVIEIRMTPEEFDGLKATINLWQDRRLSGYRVAAAGEVRPIVVHPIAAAVIWPDAVQENVLLTVVAPSGGQMILSVPLAVAADIAHALPDLLVQMRAANPTKQ